jgi:hypothetical protein
MHNLRPAEWCIIVGPYSQRHHHPTDLSTSDRSASPAFCWKPFVGYGPSQKMVPPVRNVGHASLNEHQIQPLP